MLNFKNKFETYRTRFENLLENYFDNECNGIPEILKESMSYAIKDGGKRVRPVLCFATAEMLGVELKNVEYYALAIEMIHSYSLVHDDLPAMDNDDYRRGKLSTHKKFGDGAITWIGADKKYMRVKFRSGEKQFIFPDAFVLGFLEPKQ